MKYTLGSSAPSYIFHNQHKTLNNLYTYTIYIETYQLVNPWGNFGTGSYEKHFCETNTVVKFKFGPVI